MSLVRVFWTIFFPAIIAWSFSKTMEYERTANRLGVILDKKPGRLTMVYNSPLIMPGMLLVFAVAAPLAMGFKLGLDYLLGLMLEVFIILSIYYLILLCCLPLLRRVFSARACATLWILPAFLYWLPHMWRNEPIEPRVVLKLPPHLAKILLPVWLVGFAVVFAWKITAHLRFRREVLENACPVNDPEILALWEREQQLIERKKPIPLLYSDCIISPMTVGRNEKAIRTLLPRRGYTTQELQLIFRHELRHVQRMDVDTKMFYAFCQAMCWFNPLVWIAMDKAAADLELSCDEMVLYGREERQRRQYAELLLDSAGDDRGFTTCLSASAKTLRYRLKNVMQERRRLSGTALVGLSLAALLLCCGMVVVSRTYGTMDEVVLSQFGRLDLGTVYATEDGSGYSYGSHEEVFAWDESALLAELREIQVTKVMDSTAEPDFSDGPRMYLGFYGLWMDLSDEWLWIHHCSSMPELRGVYRVDSPVDWEALFAALDFEAPDPDPGPVRPRLNYYIDHVDGQDEAFGAEDRLLARTNTNGVWNPEAPLTDWDHAGGMWGVTLPENATVRFDFTYDPVWYTVEVIGRNGEETYTVKGEDLPEHTMKLAPYSANYRIKAHFRSYQETTYDMEFYFRIQQAGEE